MGTWGLRTKTDCPELQTWPVKLLIKSRNNWDVYIKTQVKQKARQIVSDPVHSPFKEFIKLLSERSFRAAAATKNIYKKSIITKTKQSQHAPSC